MTYFSLRIVAGLFLAAACSTGAAFAQSGEVKPADQQGAVKGENGKETVKTDEFAEAARTINGPAGNPECVWHGRRVVSLLWRDDIDTAFRHLDLYDRFGCPGPYLQAAFRCLIRQTDKTTDLHTRVHGCWLTPAPPAAAGVTGSSSSTSTGGARR